MDKVKSILLTAALALAITLTLSCSDSGNDESGGSSPSVGEGSSSSEGTQGTVSSSSDGGSSSSAMTISSSSDGGQAESKIVKSKISGVSQKGPFVEGTRATLYELDGNFTQTGRQFFDIIADNKGTFEIKNVELVSPYAALEADGYYRNEVTGKTSDAPIKLYAIADIREKDNVNVNLLTHLEYYRVLVLAEGGKTVAEAKKQAQKEILAVFGINGEFENSEDMTIFGTTEGDAALLAISILLQGNLGEGEFSQRLTNFAQSIKENGAWDNEAEKNKIANWALEANLASINNSILSWGLSSDVPDFGKYVYDYWTENYGLGKCNASNEGDVENNIFVCKNNIWQRANNTDRYCFEYKNCLTDSRDGNVYRVATINNLTFMIDELKYAGNDGTLGRVICVNDNLCDYQYRIYTWDEAQNACPFGWRLPNDDEAECVSGYDEKCIRGELNPISISIYPYFWSSTGYSWKDSFSQTDAERYLKPFQNPSQVFCVQN